ncbi:unnamed protein product [Pieris brassicae]|uniref:BPTI/Kunitz inhibitor domain-containing protein n=1 Tax=Pieris brassicae TaxID=7116 RepID=A0A9P0T557_PIEBR|nr:unnamed protein product [Pieris brassicae]
MYYWRPGSRCEVGLWRGCLPNLNMFQDEYECVATCIYSSRAGPSDFHSIDAVEQIETTELEILTTTSNGTAEENTTIGNTLQHTDETAQTVAVEGGNETSTNIDAATTVAA